MAKPATRNRSNAASCRSARATTLEMVRLACPDATQASRSPRASAPRSSTATASASLHERLIVETADSLVRRPRRPGDADPPAAHRRGLCRLRPWRRPVLLPRRHRGARRHGQGGQRRPRRGSRRSGRLRQRRPAQARIRGRHGCPGARAAHGGRGRRRRLRAGHRREPGSPSSGRSKIPAHRSTARRPQLRWRLSDEHDRAGLRPRPFLHCSLA